MIHLTKFNFLNNITFHRCRNVSSVTVSRINKILVANRGEIACRIIRTAKKLGIQTVAVYSDADRDALHVESADEAYHIGPASSSQSYLRQDKIIAIAKKANCQAIHPGYGFLSENAEFAEFCQKENFIFIGPPAKAIRNMGIKSTSKAIMSKAGVPIIEGYHDMDQSNKTLQSEAERIGFPVMIKAVKGGGGKGMRIAWRPNEFIEALESARVESQKSFGDSAVLLEKFVKDPRHIEVQIFADKYGNVVHLFERDCSIQRRHQKVIEEAPAPHISEEVRSELGTVAVRAAKAVNYVGAGTVEFIMDKENQSFHFMEMNTRLQVEHPVTEAITGKDLVEWQFRIAAGEELPVTQEEITLNGHAFEARIYAENPDDNFLPGAGPLLHLTKPEATDNVRIETGVRQNDEVTVHYDPMIAKLIVWGKDRNEALNILENKLSEYNIVGLQTNIDFIKDICLHPKFQEGQVHTGFIAQNNDVLFRKIQVPNEVVAQGTLAVILHEELESLKSCLQEDDLFQNPFVTETGFRINHSLKRSFEFVIRNEKFVVNVDYVEPERYLIRINDLGPWRKVSGKLRKQGNILELISEIDGITRKSRIVRIPNVLHLFDKHRKWDFVIPTPKYSTIGSEETAIGNAISPMPGIVDKIFVKEGDIVKTGDPLIVIIAMKMEYMIRASSNSTIKEIVCKTGENVAKGKVLITVN